MFTGSPHAEVLGLKFVYPVGFINIYSLPHEMDNKGSSFFPF